VLTVLRWNLRAVVFLIRRSMWQPINRRGLGGGVLLVLLTLPPALLNMAALWAPPWLYRRIAQEKKKTQLCCASASHISSYASVTGRTGIESVVAVQVTAWQYAVGRQQKRVRVETGERVGEVVSRNTLRR